MEYAGTFTMYDMLADATGVTGVDPGFPKGGGGPPREANGNAWPRQGKGCKKDQIDRSF